MSRHIPLTLLPMLFSAAASSAFASLPAPSNVTATAAGPAAIAVSWTDNAATEQQYIVEHNQNGSWVNIATLPANSTHFYHRGLSSGSTHRYRVQAVDSPAASALVQSNAATTFPFQPNILFFLADDMGYKDIVGLRNEVIDGPTIYETPAIDNFLNFKAITIRNAYCSGPRCVVARRSMQTGKYDWRPEAVPNNDYYVDKDSAPIGGGLWAGGVTVAGAQAGAGVSIPFDNQTYGEAMQAAGYRTCFIGKYHLGESAPTLHTPTGYRFGDQPGRGPVDQGYDVSIGAGHAGAPPASYFALLNQNPGAAPNEYTFELPDLDGSDFLLPAVAAAPVAGEYITDRLTKKAIGFMQDAIQNHSGQPFHLTLAHYAVHTPAEAKIDDINYFKSKKAAMAAAFSAHPAGPQPLITDTTSRTRVWQDNVVYAAMMKSYDDSFQALMDYLNATDDPRFAPGTKLIDTNVIVISSDHGGKSTTPIEDQKSVEDDALDPVNTPAVYVAANQAYRSGTPNAYSGYPTSNYPFSQGKTWVYEGGLKVPLLVYVPGLTAGGSASDAFVHHADLFATFVDLAGGNPSPESTDSTSFMLPLGVPDVSARTEMHHLFTNANQGTGNPALGAYRKGDYKLLYFMVQRRVELYHLAADPYEQNDLSQSRPDLAAEMLHALYQQALSTGMSMPSPGSNTWTSEQSILVNNGMIASLPALPDASPTWVNGGAQQISRSSIELNWQNNASNATHSVIYRRADAEGESNYREIGYVPVDVTRFRDTQLIPGGTYRYRVVSENLGGWSSAATPNATVNLVDAGPDNLPILAVDDEITVAPGEQRIFYPLLNDQGEGALRVTAVSAPSEGSATFDGTRIFYRAPEGFSGTATLTYTVEDSGLPSPQTDSATVTLVVPATPPTLSLLEGWAFSEAVGTDLNDLTNTGSLGSLWRFNSNDITNGAGQWQIIGDGGTQTRKLPERNTANALVDDEMYASPILSGKYRLEIGFASWNVDALSNGDAWKLKLNDSAASQIAQVSFEITSSDISIILSAAGAADVTRTFGLTESAARRVAIDFDFDQDRVDFLLNDAVIHSDTFSGLNLGQFVYVKTGAWTTAATSILLDHLKLFELEPAATLYDAFSSVYPWQGVRANAKNDDPDQDGFSNLLEFALGLQPTVADAGAVSVVSSGGQPKIRFTPMRDTQELIYKVQFSEDLTDWTSLPEVLITSQAGSPVEIEISGGNKRFARVSVSE